MTHRTERHPVAPHNGTAGEGRKRMTKRGEGREGTAEGSDRREGTAEGSEGRDGVPRTAQP